jgi:ATP-dependent Clp protease ATP-binding subunit ClpB
MRLDKFTLRAQEAIQTAIEIAVGRHHQQVETEHLLASLLEKPDGISRVILGKLGANQNVIRWDVQSAIERLPQVSGTPQQYFSSTLSQVFSKAEKQAEKMRDEFISTEHLLLSILETRENTASKILAQHGINISDLFNVIQQLRGSTRITDQNAEETFQALSQHTTDLTQLARKKLLTPVFGRDDEIRQIIRVLLRRSRNSAAVTGEPGVGKNAVVEGLAYNIVKGDVPAGLEDKRLVALDIGALIAEARDRGEFIARLKAVLLEVKESEGKVILFMDNLDAVLGTGASEGAANAVNLLKPMLARGEVQCICTMTPADYRESVKKDTKIDQLFQRVRVDPLSVEDTICILRELRELYELHHGVRIRDSALVAAAMLSHHYISGRFLPIKALDLIDDAAAKIRSDIESVPTELDKINRRKMRLEIECEALRRETDDFSKARLEELEDELRDLKELGVNLLNNWIAEKENIERLRTLRAELEMAKFKEEKARQAGDFARAAELRYKAIPDLERRLAAAESQGIPEHSIKEEVDEEAIATIVSGLTQISVPKLLESLQHLLLDPAPEPTPQKSLSIFLCHASEDKPQVRALRLRLIGSGFRPWLDEEDLLPGQNWNQEIKKAARRCDVILVCLSRHSEKPGYFQTEIVRALDLHDEDSIYLIPVKLEECRLPDGLAKLQCVDLSQDDNYMKLEKSLKEVRSIREHSSRE